MIPITRVHLDEEIEKQVLSVIRSGHIAQGPKVAEFERRCAEMAGTRAAVAVNSGTAALVLALHALEVGPGDEVVTSPLTFAATLNAILEVGATARFGDIGDDFNLDIDSVEPLLGPHTRTLMPVHLFGQPADMARASNLAMKNGLHLVEDAAQAHFASLEDGRRVGSFGLGCFSFYATKNLQCGEGGVIATDDDGLELRMRMLRNQGMVRRYEYEAPGYNLRLTDLAAAITIPQFDCVEDMLARRRRNAAALSEGLKETPGLLLPTEHALPGHVWHQYTVQLTEDAAIDRNGLATVLEEQGIGHGFYYPYAVYDYDCYRSHPRVVIDGSPRAERAAASVISLPVHPHLTDGELDRIVTVVHDTLSG
ncbi:MAG: aminotransferase [Gemmatimonadetes bacterium]|jgi:dTDP-4-amino-4,6-dideoxygalactose transaminase|nr:aminotransferase [Gemmatimonadota bacterium]